ncbi:MAG: NUMOD4 domain-containing protein [Erysipelotrichaceae bacterium]
MEEIWKDVKNFEGLYQISNLGNVKSLKKMHGVLLKEERILKPSLSKHGYRKVNLCKCSKFTYIVVSRLVAINFIDNPYNKPQVNHIDGIKTNDNVNNLEWCTASENLIHAYKTGLKNSHGENHSGHKLINEQILLIRNTNNISNREIARLYNISPASVTNIKKHKSWNHLQ